MGDELVTGLVPGQTGEPVDGRVAEIENLLMTLARAHRRRGHPGADRNGTIGNKR